MRAEDLAATKIVADNIRQGSLRGFGQGEYGGDRSCWSARAWPRPSACAPATPSRLISPNGGGHRLRLHARGARTYTVGGVFASA